jgi:hypothetical protein
MNGYFSLIQYCPLMERREAANVGVVLIVPDARYAGVRIFHDHARLKKMFGKHAGEKAGVAVLIQSIAGRVAAEQETLATLEGLQQFIATRANRVMLTDPCAVLVEGAPEATLEELMEDLVASSDKTLTATKAPTHSQLEQRWLTEVTRRLTSPRLAPYLRQNMEVSVPRLINPLTAPLGYQNGRFHLIQPEEFAVVSEGRIEERVSLAQRHAALHCFGVGRFIFENGFARMIFFLSSQKKNARASRKRRCVVAGDRVGLSRLVNQRSASSSVISATSRRPKWSASRFIVLSTCFDVMRRCPPTLDRSAR